MWCEKSGALKCHVDLHRNPSKNMILLPVISAFRVPSGSCPALRACLAPRIMICTSFCRLVLNQSTLYACEVPVREQSVDRFSADVDTPTYDLSVVLNWMQIENMRSSVSRYIFPWHHRTDDMNGQATQGPLYVATAGDIADSPGSVPRW